MANNYEIAIPNDPAQWADVAALVPALVGKKFNISNPNKMTFYVREGTAAPAADAIGRGIRTGELSETYDLIAPNKVYIRKVSSDGDTQKAFLREIA